MKSNNQGVKEETFIQTGRRGGEGQLGREDLRQGGSWRTGAGKVGLATQQDGDWQTGWSHICGQINWEEQLGRETGHATQGSSTRVIKFQSLWQKTPAGVEAAAEETPRVTEEFTEETHRVLEHTKTHPTRNQHQKGTISLWVEEEVTENRQRVEQVALFLLGPLSHIQRHKAVTWVTPP